MPTFAKRSGTAGMPSGVTERPRVDFNPDDFTRVIETKGARLAWSRASYCPCVSVNDQTEQSDPNCSICNGTGWLLFAPAIKATYKEVGEFTAVQKAVIGSTASVILGIVSGIYSKDNPYDAVTKRLEGKIQVTVRPENRIGFYDRLANLDATITYAQIAKADGTVYLPTRYPVIDVNLLRDVSTVYTKGTDFTLNAGQIQFATAPTEDTVFSVHYLTYPHWRVMEHPHATRITLRKYKADKTTVPTGDPVDLPLQAVCQYEWLL